jgi:hypothetical protein
MRWFDKHLNGILVLITSITILLFPLLSAYRYDFNYGDWINSLYILFINYHILIALGWYALTTIVFGLILKRKNGGILFLLFSLPSIIAMIIWISQPIIEPDSIDILVNFTLLSSVVSYIFVLLFLLLLKERWELSQLSIPKPGFSLPTYFRNLSKYSTILICVILLLISGYWYYRMEYGYKTFTGYKYLETNSPMYTFKCHPSYYEPFLFDWNFGKDVSIFGLTKVNPKLFSGVNVSDIFIRVWNSDFLNSAQHDQPIDQDMEYIKNTVPVVFEFNPAVEVGYTSKKIVNGASADYLILHITEQPDEFLSFQGTLRAACFERNGYVWVIIMQQNILTNEPDPTFDDLLQTFKVIS